MLQAQEISTMIHGAYERVIEKNALGDFFSFCQRDWLLSDLKVIII